MTTPKLPPPPRSAQSRSAFSVSLADFKTAVRQHDVRLDQIVGCEPILAAEVAMAARERQPGDAGRRDNSERDGQSESMGGMVDIARDAARRDADRPGLGIDTDAAHLRKIDHQPVVDAAEARPVVSATAYCDRQLVVASEVDGGDDISRVDASCDQQRVFVDRAIVEFAGGVVFGMLTPDKGATKSLAELGDRFCLHDAPPLMPIAPGANPDATSNS